MKLVSFYKKSNCYSWWYVLTFTFTHTQLPYEGIKIDVLRGRSSVLHKVASLSTRAELRSPVSQHEKSNPVNLPSPPGCLTLNSALPRSLPTPLFSIPPPQCLGGPYALRAQTTLTSLYLDCFALEQSFRSFAKEQL